MQERKRVLDDQDFRCYGACEHPFAEMPSLEEWLLYFLEHYVKTNTKPSTYANFRSYINSHICPILGDYLLNEVNDAILQTYVNMKHEHGRLDGKGGLSTKTLREHIMVLKLAFKRAIHLGIVGYDPCRYIEYPREEKKEVRVLSKSNQRKLSNAISPQFQNNTLMPALLAMHAGLRIGEVSALKVEDINMEDRLIRIDESLNRVMTFEQDGSTCCPLIYQSTKSGKVRFVPMNEDLYKALDTYMNTMPQAYKRNGNAPLFLTSRETVMEPRRINYHFKKLLNKLNIQDIHFHCLRHTFATRALEAGIPMKYCSVMLGHASTGITENLYAHASEDQLKKEIKKLNISAYEVPCYV